MPISASDILAYIAVGREQWGVEFKAAGPRMNNSLTARVIRGMLAMGNRRDGGVVIIGVNEVNHVPLLHGLSVPDAATWLHDHLADKVSEYADPRLAFDAYPVTVSDKTVIAIEVREFTDVPVVCKKSLSVNNEHILRNGAIYVRSNRKPESREVANYDEMRELLELATDKEVRRFVTRAQNAGLAITGSLTAPVVDGYAAERGDL